MGTLTAPTWATPRSATVHSTRVAPTKETLSPAFTPSPIRPQAASSARPPSSAQVSGFHPPSALRSAATRCASPDARSRNSPATERTVAKSSLSLCIEPIAFCAVAIGSPGSVLGLPPAAQLLDAFLLGRIAASGGGEDPHAFGIETHPDPGEVVPAHVSRVRLDGLVAGFPGDLSFRGLLVRTVRLAVRLPSDERGVTPRDLEPVRVLREMLLGEGVEVLQRRRIVAPLPEIVPDRHPFGGGAGPIVRPGRERDDLRRHLQARGQLIGRPRWTGRLALRGRGRGGRQHGPGAAARQTHPESSAKPSAPITGRRARATPAGWRSDYAWSFRLTRRRGSGCPRRRRAAACTHR